MVHSAMAASIASPMVTRRLTAVEQPRAKWREGPAQPFEKARFAEGKTLDFASPRLGFSFPWLGFSFPRFALKENSAAPRNSMNNNVNSTCMSAPGSPPKPGSRQFQQGAVGIADVEAHPSPRPSIFADDFYAAFEEPPTPCVEILLGYRKRQVQTSNALMARDLAAPIDDVVFGRPRLKHQQDAARGDFKGDKARRVNKRLEPEELAVERRGAREVTRIERCFKQAVDPRRAWGARHAFLEPSEPAYSLVRPPWLERQAAADDRQHSGQDRPQHLIRNAGRVMAPDHNPRD